MGKEEEMERNREWNIKCSSLFSFSFGLTHCYSSFDRCPLLFSSMMHSATHYLTPLHTTSLHYIQVGCRLMSVRSYFYFHLLLPPKGHWNQTVEGLAQSVLKMYMEMDPTLYDKCARYVTHQLFSLYCILFLFLISIIVNSAGLFHSFFFSI